MSPTYQVLGLAGLPHVQCELDELRDTIDELILRLEAPDGQIFDICFDSHVSYRWTDEGDRLRTLPSMPTGPTLTLLEVTNSEFIAWYAEESLGVRDNLILRHFIVLTTNHIVDILALDVPTAKELGA